MTHIKYPNAEAKLATAVKLFKEFTKQYLSTEMNEEEYKNADFEYAYNKFIVKSEAMLAELEKTE